jgi:arylsulfatase A-like enzyme
MRRIGARALAAAAALTLVSAGSSPFVRGPLTRGLRAGAPNVLIIVTDDQRARGTLAVMPQTTRWFRDRGAYFPNAFATTPLCCPSRASVLTGQYAHNHGVMTNGEGAGLEFEHTLPRYLRQAGYQTGVAGKFIQGVGPDFDPPYFDRWATFRAGYYDTVANLDGELSEVSEYVTDYLGEWSLRYLRGTEKEDDRPWLLYLAPSAPHRPSLAAPAYFDDPVPPLRDDPSFAEEDRSDKPTYAQTSEATAAEIQHLLRKELNPLRLARDASGRGLRRFLKSPGFSWVEGARVWRDQLNTLRSVDDVVGRLFEELGELGERRNTLAFFLSDNGLLLGEHGLYGKRVPYDPSVRIPLLVRWPKRVAGGTVDPRLAATLDVLPTVMEAAGLEPVGGHVVDGRSLLGGRIRSRLLLEQESNWRPGLTRLPDWSALRTSSFLFVEYRSRQDGSVSFREYYDLAEDPWQLSNLLGDGDAANDPDVAALSARLRRDAECRGPACP